MKKSILCIATGLFTVLLLSGCGPSEAEKHKAEEQALFDEVMDVHDPVMEKMGEVNRYGRQLKEFDAEHADSLSKDTRAEIDDVLRQLEEADNGMMAWMNLIKNPSELREEGRSHLEIMTYLRKEQKNIEEVEQNVNTSLHDARQLKKKLGISNNQ